MEKRIFSDPSIPAFFQASNKDFKIIPYRNEDGRVEFVCEGTNIDAALTELYSNVEVHILDFNEDIYGEKIRINFVSRLRDEVKFNSVEELSEQIKKDIQKTRDLLST